METRFKWTCSYMGCCWFEVWDPELGTFELEERHALDDYERSIMNYDAEGIARNVKPFIGTIRRTHYPGADTPLPQRIVDAFNAWRAAEHEAFCAQLLAQPHRYGPAEELIPWLNEQRRPVVIGAYYSMAEKRAVRADEPVRQAA